MNFSTTLKASAIAVSMMLAGGAQATALSKSEYKQAKERAEASYKSEKANCGAMSGNAKDICIEEAKGHERVAKAEAEYSYSKKGKDLVALNKAKVESNYKVAKERCDDQNGNAKDVCVKEAKATRDKGMADIKANKEIGEARKDAADTKRDADYKVAAEKCDAMSGDAKSTCVKSAKSQYGKM